MLPPSLVCYCLGLSLTQTTAPSSGSFVFVSPLLWIFFFTQAFEINFLTSQENEIFYEYLLKDNSSDMMLIMLLRF